MALIELEALMIPIELPDKCLERLSAACLVPQDGVAAECGHAFCRACITEYLEAAQGVASCQACEKPLTIDLHNAPVVCSLPCPHFLRAITRYLAGSS